MLTVSYQPGDQGPGVASIRIVLGAEYFAKVSLFQPDFSCIRDNQNQDTSRGVPFARSDRYPDVYAEHRSIDGMA